VVGDSRRVDVDVEAEGRRERDKEEKETGVDGRAHRCYFFEAPSPAMYNVILPGAVLTIARMP
jgi:hypothetical protein